MVGVSALRSVQTLILLLGYQACKKFWLSFPQESGGGSRKVEASGGFFVVGVCALRSVVQTLILLVG